MRSYLPTGTDELITLAETDAPAAKAGEVIVRVEAFSLNRADVIRASGPGSAVAPGFDAVGTVAEAAPEGGGPAVGTRVVGLTMLGGTAAELVAIPVADLTPLPPGLSPELAVSVPLAGVTALRLVRAAGDLAGKRVLATGAGGGVGPLLVELAAAAGAEVTAVAAKSSHDRLRELGAATLLERADDASQLSDAGAPFDVSFESVGGARLSAAAAATVPGGLVLWYGQAGGEPATIDYFALPRETTIRRFAWTTAGPAAADLAELLRLVHAGRLHPEVTEVHDWSRTPELLRALRDRTVRGKVVLTVPGE